MLPLRFEKLLFCLIIILFVLLLLAYRIFPLKYHRELNSVALEMNIEPSLIAAIIKLESNFDELALSHSGAFGLMQLMPETATWLKTKYVIQGTWRDPLNNIKLGTFYLKRLLTQFDNDIHLTLNAYHMGPNKLKNVLLEHQDFRKTMYTKRISFYQVVYKLLYNGFFVYPGE